MGEEECDSCIEHGLHLKDVNNHDRAVNDNESCEVCLYHEQHLQLATLSRQQYRKDHGIWYMVYGIWYMVYGIRYMVYGIWYMVYGKD